MFFWTFYIEEWPPMQPQILKMNSTLQIAGNVCFQNNCETHQVVPRVYECVCAGLSMRVTSWLSVPFTAQVDCGPNGGERRAVSVSKLQLTRGCRISRAAHVQTLRLPLCHQRVRRGGRLAHIPLLPVVSLTRWCQALTESCWNHS